MRDEQGLLRSHFLLYALEVVNAVPRRNRRVVPAVIDDQLAAARDKLAKVRVRQNRSSSTGLFGRRLQGDASTFAVSTFHFGSPLTM